MENIDITQKQKENTSIYQQIFNIIAEERKRKGKPAVMLGKTLTHLINAIDTTIDYEEKPKE